MIHHLARVLAARSRAARIAFVATAAALAPAPDAQAAATEAAQTAPAQPPPSTAPPAQRPSSIPPARPRRVSLDAGRVTRLNYGYAPWNTDPKKVDSASLLLREGKTGKLVQISLEETGPDSAVFSGSYSVNWQALEDLAPEFYVPPQLLLDTNQGLKRLAEMIAKGELKRRPFILRRAPRSGTQFIEIYDTKEQAREAMRAFRAELQALELQNKKVPSDSETDASALGASAAEREAAARAMAERVRLDQVESSKSMQRLAAFLAASPEERAERKRKAKALAAQAMGDYQAGRFQEARKKFEGALDLDPETKAYDFQFGVVLYKLDDVNRAIVFLKSAEAGSDPAERDYFLGLCHFRQRELALAFDYFGKSKGSKNGDVKASSSFYQGVIRFEERKHDDAQPLLQEVLDTSQDAKLSERAEGYIEQILRIKQFEAERAKKWTISLNVGEIYDSNVTLAATSAIDQGVATNYEGYRTLAQTSIRYRPLYEVDREFAAQVDLMTMYTLDRNLSYAQAIRNVDPTVIGLSTPWTRKGTLWGKGHKLDLQPGYESTRMSIEDNTDKEILNSLVMSALNTLIVSDDWFSNGNLELRKDTSMLNSSTGANDSSAIRLRMTWGNMLFLNKDKSSIVTSNLAYTTNQAQGSNMSYDRFDLGGTYIGQLPNAFAYTAGLSYFFLSYGSNPSGRVDNSVTAATSLSRKLNDALSASFAISYNDNMSNIEANAFKKLSVMLTLSSGWHF